MNKQQLSCTANEPKQGVQGIRVVHNFAWWLWYLPHHRQGAHRQPKEATEESTSTPD